MFSNVSSQYALKKAVKHELDKIGIARIGWGYESERSHHLKRGTFEAVNIFDEAINRAEELKAANETING